WRQAVFHRSGVDIRFEGRAGLSQSLGGAVELTAAVVAASDDGSHSAIRLYDDYRALLDIVLLAVLAEVEFKRFLGRVLDTGVESGMGNQRVVSGRRQPLHLVKCPVQVIVRTFAIAAVDFAGGPEPDLKYLSFGHEAGIDQIVEHDIGAGACGRQIDVGSIFARRLEKAGQHRR